MLRAYQYRIYPTKDQKNQIHQHIGACRFLYNHSLEQKIKSMQLGEKVPNYISLNNQLPILKEQYEWLKEINSQSLQSTNMHLDTAFTNFFRKKADFPKFKSKKNPVQSFQIPQHYKVKFEENKIELPKIGVVKTILHRAFCGALKTATVTATRTGKYFISVLVDDGTEVPDPAPFDSNSTIGIDVGISSLITTSKGDKIENPEHLKNSLERLKHLQRSVARKTKGSQNWKKAVLKVSKLHERVSNQRRDFLHKNTFKIVSENQAIAVETLNIAGMLKNNHFARSIADSSWSEFFRQLEYKCRWYGKTLLTIGQFEPSSKICSKCGYINQNLQLSDRNWICPDCGIIHDRDINAAINIKKMAIQKQNIQGRNCPVSL